jgi:stage II sporulation protein M
MKNFLIDNYSKCWKFLIECRWYNVFVTGIFSLLFLIGFTFPVFFRAEIIVFIGELIELVEGKGLIETFFFIFFNNLKASFLSLLLGVSFGIFPFLIAVSNGYLIGFVSREVAMIEGISVLWRLIPHGIFELPAVIFSIGIGLKIGSDLLDHQKNKKERLRINYVEGLRVFIFVVIPLLLLAGIIESVFIWLSV